MWGPRTLLMRRYGDQPLLLCVRETVRALDFIEGFMGTVLGGNSTSLFLAQGVSKYSWLQVYIIG